MRAVIIIIAAILTTATTSISTPDTNQDSEKDDDTSRKIIGSSVVTSVSVILNGEEPPKFSDAVGKPVPRPLVPPQVASPINLLNPDRYEFYTFNDSGDLIKRLMTMKEIQSIVAGGSNEGSVMQQTLSKDKYFDDNVEDIVTSVQKVLNEEVAANKNSTNEHNVLDTPDVSSSWSIILPAIFGNTGDDIRPHKPQISMTPDAVIVEATEKTEAGKVDVKVKPSNIGSQNKIEDPSEKKTTAKPTIAEAPIVHIIKKEPAYTAFEASTPRSSVGGYQEHTIDDVHTNLNHSFQGYRRKTTAAPESATTESNTKASRPTPSRFVTRRRPTPETHKIEMVTAAAATNAPQFKETTVEYLTRLPAKESTSETTTETESMEVATEIATEIAVEGSTEEDSIISTTESDAIEPLTTESPATESIIDPDTPELTTYDQRYAETTTAEAAVTEAEAAVTEAEAAVTEAAIGIVTAQTEYVNDEHAITTEYSTVFDSSDSFNQILESLKDDPSSESVEITTEHNAVASTIYDDVTTTESFMVEENDDQSTEREMVKLPSIDSSQRINQSNVYLNEEQFVDEQEPLVFDIPTTTELSVETTEYSEEATNKDEDLTLPIFQEVKLQYPESSSIFEEKNPIVQQVDNFIHENPAEIADSLAVESVHNENKVANIVSLDNLTLAEYIDQAATVASILSNNADYVPIKEIVSQLVLSPQLRHDEPAVTTNVPANFHEMEVMSLKKEDASSPENEDDVSYETSVIKETSSISMSSNHPVEKLNENPADDSTSNDVVKNDLTAELFKSETDASTEISVESDVHEVMNMIKLKMPSKVHPTSSSLNENRIQEEITTFTTVTEMSQETSTINEEPATVRSENTNSEGTTMGAETHDDILSTTVNPNIDSFDGTTVAENADLSSQTTSDPTTTASESLEGNFVSDILNTIGMIDEDVIAQKFNYTFNREDDDENIDDIDLLNESTTMANEMTTTKINNEQTTVYNHFKEEIENEIIKKLQETLEERLHPKTERIDIDRSSYTTESAVETTTDAVEQIDVSTNKEMDDVETTESVLNSTEEDWSENVNLQFTTETELNDGTATTTSSETTEFSNDLNVVKNDEAADEADLSQDEVSTTESATTVSYPKDEEVFIKLGETTILPATVSPVQTEDDASTQASIINLIPSKKHATLKIDDHTSGITKPSQPFRPHPIEQKIFHVNTVKPSLKMPPSINSLKIKVSNSNRRPMPVKLEPAPKQALGLEQSTVDTNADILEFSKLCNELAFTFWKSLTSEGISSARSLVISPFALTSMLAMIFLGARGSTSGEMNEMLRLDDMVTFNPHLVFRNITDSVENAKGSGIANSAFVRELFSDRSKGKILSFYKDKAQQFYSGHVEEVNFNVINDIIRRRTNLLVKRHTWSKITEYIKSNNIWLNAPLAGLSANIFQTDCSKATVNERDGEMFFQVLPAIRQRRLVPIPAAVYKSGSNFMAGYDPEIDATAVAFGGNDVVSTIFVMPGQQGHSAPGDNLERLESVFMANAVTNNAWRRLLTTLMPRQGLEVQIPRFSHRSFINATYGLQKMGLNNLFNFDKADLRGLTGSTTKDMYISDMIQINTFSTCGEDKIGEQHHVELYPAPPIQQRNINYQESLDADYADVGVTSVSDAERSLYDPLFDDRKYLELPLPLRPRQARIPEAPRLRFDKPFLYFVRHNPTGMILYMGRFNPRLLP